MGVETGPGDSEVIGVEGYVRNGKFAYAIGGSGAVEMADWILNLNRRAGNHRSRGIEYCATHRGGTSAGLRTRGNQTESQIEQH